eukprot:gene12051-13295_t
MASFSNTRKWWLLEKYARFVPSTAGNNALPVSAAPDKSYEGQWKYFCASGTASSNIKITITAPLNLLIASGEAVVLESFSLLGNEKDSWIKAVCKGDSMLILYKLQADTRRFRIKFADGEKLTSQENCLDFVRNISKYIPVKIVESENENSGSQSMLLDQSQTQLNSSVEYECTSTPRNANAMDKERNIIKDAQIFSTMSVQQIAETVLQKSPANNLPTCYKLTNPSVEANFDAMVKSCLLDPNFPAFVDQVEKSLKTLIS